MEKTWRWFGPNDKINGDFKESTHLDPRLIDVISTFETVHPDVPMRVDHAPLMLGA